MKIPFISLLATLGSAFAAQVSVLGINDMHANIDDLPQLATFLKTERAADPDVLLFSAGDNRTGNPYVDNGDQPGVPMIKLMNMLGFDLSTMGNHEFDSGLIGLRDSLDAANFNFVCANVQADGGAELNLKPYHIFERDGVRIGVIGLVQIGSNGLPDVHPDNGKGLKFSDPFKAVRDYAYLREKCDVLILLTHLGFEDDIKLATLFPEADAIIGGHTHTRVDGAHMVGGVMITQTENKVKYITRLTFDVEDGKIVSKKAELIPLRELAKDADMQAAVDTTKASPYMQRRLGSVKPAITRRESLGCLMADSLRAYAKTDVAVVNFGNVRLEEFPEGPFTVADCYRLDPFCNKTVVFKATGKELTDFLNAIPSSDHHGAPCVSGIRYKAVKPVAELQPMRITEITLPDGTPIDPDKYYTVATNSYLMSTVTPLPADPGVAHDMDGARAIMLYMDGKENVDYSNVSNIDVTVE